ncbi:MAG: LLM class flavin-dependent oxidoreductase [Acidimicrobiia bacterium]
MTDYGREVRFGVFLIPMADGDPVAQAVEAERLGLDYVGIQDHPYQRRFVEVFALLSMIAGSTTRIGLFPDVACLPLRPPAVMAKTAASIDVLSGGRFELGLGAGAFWDAIDAYGGTRLSPGESLDALEEAIEVIRKVWSGDRGLRFEGVHYHLSGAHSGPVPSHPIGIWLGVYGPRALGIAGRLADGWVPSLRDDLTTLSTMSSRLDEAATVAGRDPSEIRRILNISGTITDGPSSGVLRGPVDQWAEELTVLALGHGFDTFITSADDPGHLARFAEEVAPTVREMIVTERGGRAV